MVFRLLYLVALIAMVGGDAGAAADDENVRKGGEGFGNIVMLVVMLGAAVLAVVVVLGILALTGQFESDTLIPRV